MCIVSSSEDRAQSALRAVAQFASVAGQVQHDELRSASLQVAHEALAQCEAYGQRCVEFLLTALRQSTKANASAVEDVVWMVYKVARGSETAKAWIVHAGGVAALRAALLCHADQPQLMENGVWTAYALDGLRSLAELLEGCRGDTPSDLALRGAICGALYQLVKPRRHGTLQTAACQTLETVQPESVVLLITEALHIGRLPEDALWTSCTVLETLVEKDARMASVFIARGGCHLLVRMLSRDAPQGFDGQDLRRAIASLVVTLADACPEAVQAFRSAGASKVLLEEGLKGDGADVEAAMWAIGAIDGLDTVLQAMRASGPVKPKVLLGGSAALTTCAFKASDREELQKLPAAIVLLLEIITNPGDEAKLQRVAVKALGCTLAALTPHAPPGHVPDVDRGVEETWWNGDDGNDGYDVPVAPVAQAAAEAIGRIALTTSQWRPVLHRCSMEALLGWIRSGVPDRKLHKELSIFFGEPEAFYPPPVQSSDGAEDMFLFFHRFGEVVVRAKKEIDSMRFREELEAAREGGPEAAAQVAEEVATANGLPIGLVKQRLLPEPVTRADAVLMTPPGSPCRVRSVASPCRGRASDKAISASARAVQRLKKMSATPEADAQSDVSDWEHNSGNRRSSGSPAAPPKVSLGLPRRRLALPRERPQCCTPSSSASSPKWPDEHGLEDDDFASGASQASRRRRRSTSHGCDEDPELSTHAPSDAMEVVLSFPLPSTPTNRRSLSVPRGNEDAAHGRRSEMRQRLSSMANRLESKALSQFDGPADAAAGDPASEADSARYASCCSDSTDSTWETARSCCPLPIGPEANASLNAELKRQAVSQIFLFHHAPEQRTWVRKRSKPQEFQTPKNHQRMNLSPVGEPGETPYRDPKTCSSTKKGQSASAARSERSQGSRQKSSPPVARRLPFDRCPQRKK